MKQLDSRAADEESFRNSEWTPEAKEAIICDAANFKTPHGTIGSLIEQRPKELIRGSSSKTNYSKLGTKGALCSLAMLAASAAQGAVNAMQDAVILANCLYDMTSIHPRNIPAAFTDYHNQRHEHIVSQYETRKMNAKLMYGQSWSEKLLRFAVFNPLPRTFMEKGLLKEGACRPQMTFMPRIPDRGRGASLPQKPSKRYTEEQEATLPVTI